MTTVLGRVSRSNWAQLYIGAVVAAGLGTAALSFVVIFPGTWMSQHPMWLLAAIGILAQFATQSLFGPSSISLSFPFAFLNLLWFGPGAAVLTNAGAVLLHGFYPVRRPWKKVAFNFASLALAVAAASAVYYAAGGSLPPEGVVRSILPALMAALAYFFVNTLTVSGAISATSGQPVLQVWASNHRWLSLYYAALGLGALLVATTFSDGSNLAFLVFVPALAVPWAFIRLCVVSAKELAQKRRHVEQLTLLQRVALRIDSAPTLETSLAEALAGAKELASPQVAVAFLSNGASSGIRAVCHTGSWDHTGKLSELCLSNIDLAALSSGARTVIKGAGGVGGVGLQAGGGNGVHPTAVYLPMLVGNRLLGAVGLYFKDKPSVPDEALKLLNTISDYAAAVADRHLRTLELESSRYRVFQTQETVRRQVSASLHGPIQTRLLVLWHRLGQLDSQLHSPDLRNKLGEFRGEIQGLQEFVRVLSAQLYPSIVKVGLVPALKSLANRFEGLLDIEMFLGDGSLELDGRLEGVGEDVILIAYRVVEEALANAAKHARASRVRIQVDLADSSLAVSVEDNGVGFDADRVVKGLGLCMMADYVGAAKGTLTVGSVLGLGTKVEVVLPLENRQHAAGEDFEQVPAVLVNAAR